MVGQTVSSLAVGDTGNPASLASKAARREAVPEAAEPRLLCTLLVVLVLMLMSHVLCMYVWLFGRC